MKCLPCEGGTPPLQKEKIDQYMLDVKGWQLNEQGHIVKSYSFKDFRQAMDFVTHIAIIAETEGHYPDFSVHYNKIDVELWTHAINGLSENDFILAAKIDEAKDGKQDNKRK